MAESQFQPFNIESADQMETQVAPDGYRPHWDHGPAIDADAGEPTMPCWRQYFAGGSNRLHFILIDDMENPHIVEQDGFGGPYSVLRTRLQQTVRKRLRRILARRTHHWYIH